MVLQFFSLYMSLAILSPKPFLRRTFIALQRILCLNIYAFMRVSIFETPCTPSNAVLFGRVLGDSTPRYVGPSVGWSVPFLLFRRF